MADILRRIRRYRRFQPIERVFPDRMNPLELLGREEIFHRYRFWPETIMIMTNLLFREIETSTLRSSPLPPLLSFLVTLQFYASGSHYLIIGDFHRVSKASVCRSVIKTTTAICGLMNRFVKFPDEHDYPEVQREFYSIAGFPKVIGAIDCTHVTIQAPSDNEAAYINRKGHHSINIQVVCNAKFRVTNVVARWPGSVHDSRIFRESELARKLEQGNDAVLLGDSGYPCKNYLLTPYLQAETPVQRRYNDAHAKSRVVIEQTFGIIKRRFPCIANRFRGSPRRACKTAVAVIILHNFGIEHNDIFERELHIWQEQPDYVMEETATGLQYRDVFANAFFA